MASAVKSNIKEATKSEASTQESKAGDVQSYLISNYRDALKKGDKSAAKSCLLAARYFSVNDPNVTNEIYLMAKSDGDVNEASKCFANIFNDLFLSSELESPRANTTELMTVVNQIKEETRILLGELKAHFLKLKSLPAPAALASRQVTSVNPSPMLSPRLRMSSEDKSVARASVSKLDNHLHSTTRNFFYQQLFDSLPEAIRKSILDHSIETCDNPIERCRLMMLTLSMISESVTTYGSRLLRSLIDLSESKKKTEEHEKSLISSHSSIMSHYAKSLLVLDAIPLVLNNSNLSHLDIDIEELFEKTLIFYSEHCLTKSSAEYEASELHEGVKKSIATRILGIEHNTPLEEAIEENLVMTLNLLCEKFIETVADANTRTKLGEIAALISDRSNTSNKFESIMKILNSLGLDDCLPDDISQIKEETNSFQPTTTPPPKGRGRPKKAQAAAAANLDETAKKNLQIKIRTVHFVFYSLIRHMFVNCAGYLKSTRSRVLVNFNNPIVSQIESELIKGSSSQRASRSKSGTSSEAVANPTKKLKLEPQPSPKESSPKEETPLNSEQSKMMDSLIMSTLEEAHKCLEFFNSNCGSYKKLWAKFMATNQLSELEWYRRFSIDGMLFSGNHESASEYLETIIDSEEEKSEIKKEQTESGVSTLTLNPGMSSTNVADLRRLVQLISAHTQRLDRDGTFTRVDELLSRLKQFGLLSNDESYANGNSIEEYMIVVQHGELKNLGFLFFDSLSMIRYCVDLMLSILKPYATSAGTISDAAIGHCIVMSQFDWPKDIYDQCISWLRIHKPKSTTPQSLSAATKFTYPEFFQYVCNPSIIEDFMAMLMQGYTLDIKGGGSNGYLNSTNARARTGNGTQSTSGARTVIVSSTSTRSGKAITTRGVNKTFKEDLKVALVGQMRSSSFLMSLDMISEFMQTSLIPFLNSVRK